MLQPHVSAGEPTVSTVSGAEMYCLDHLGYEPGNLLVGNSVYSMGLFGALSSGVRGIVGGELTEISSMISRGRHLAMQRLTRELEEDEGDSVAGISSEIVFHGQNLEFVAMGSALRRKGRQITADFSSSSDGRELLCEIEAGYLPVSFVMGNVAYSIGTARGLAGSLRQLVRGEVREYSELFAQTRARALTRIVAEARATGADAVVGIKTHVLPFGAYGMHEMLMTGTASERRHSDPLLPTIEVVTSDLPAEELWNLAHVGYEPVTLAMGTSVYSVGLIGGITSLLKGITKGEVGELTDLIYAARTQSIGKLRQQAAAAGASGVVGIRTYVYDLGGGLIEFLAVGTGVRRSAAARTVSDQLPIQAILRDRPTFFNATDATFSST